MKPAFHSLFNQQIKSELQSN